uniref:Conotoxin Cltx-1 n=1 Tax=Californiconus californicus TaxID=1736779 RepID=CUX1_CONCL|nr:RecName: Full=Conotoxin Cltx-1; AltName: Full=CalTx-1 [Californiconus californicus]
DNSCTPKPSCFF